MENSGAGPMRDRGGAERGHTRGRENLRTPQDWGTHWDTLGHTGGNKMVGNVDEHRQTAVSTPMLRIRTVDYTRPDHRSGMRCSKSVSAHAQSAQIVRDTWTEQIGLYLG